MTNNRTVISTRASDMTPKYRVLPDEDSPRYLGPYRPAAAPAMTAASVLYVIGNPRKTRPVKIGVTIDLAGRLAAIRTGRGAVMPPDVNPASVEVLAQHPGDRTDERRIHEFYAEYRTVGEWFNLAPADAEDIFIRYLAHTEAAATVARRGAGCACLRCRFGHFAGQAPADRPELVHADGRLLATINAMTHARLGVSFSDSVVALLASHCDIDRAVRLLSTLDYRVRSAA